MIIIVIVNQHSKLYEMINVFIYTCIININHINFIMDTNREFIISNF